MGLCFNSEPYDGENAVVKPKVVNHTSRELLVGYRESFLADLIQPGKSNDGQGLIVEVNEDTEGLSRLGREYYIVL